MARRRVTIISTDYDAGLKLITWKMSDVNTKEELTIAWRSTDLQQAMNINPNLTIPDELMTKFCNDIVGKTINLDMESKVHLAKTDVENGIEVMDAYPFNEVATKLAKDEQK